MSKYFKFHTVLFVTLFITHLGITQTNNINQVKKFNARNEVLVIKDGYSNDAYRAFRKKNKDKLENHVNAVDLYNQTLLESVKSHSLFEGKKVNFTTTNDAWKLPKKERSKYILVYAANNGGLVLKDKKLITGDHLEKKEFVTRSSIYLFFMEDMFGFRPKPYAIFNTFNILPTSADFMVAFDNKRYEHQLLQKYPKAKNADFKQLLLKKSPEKSAKLKSLKILINEAHLAKNFKKERVVGNLEIVKAAVYEEAILDRKPNTAYLYPSPYTKSFLVYVLSCEKGELLHLDLPSIKIVSQNIKGEYVNINFNNKAYAQFLKSAGL